MEGDKLSFYRWMDKQICNIRSIEYYLTVKEMSYQIEKRNRENLNVYC